MTPDGKYNYIAYLLADENGVSIKVAKYAGSDRVDLTENEETGYCSLIKATNNVLEEMKIENATKASNSGAYYPEAVIQFESSASFSPDTSMDDESLHSIARRSARPGPISISNVIEVGFKTIKRWWEFWKK